MRLATMADKDRIEEICNDPVLRVWTAFDGAPPCEATKYLTAPSFSVIDERGCFLALNLDPGRYVIHTNLVPDCRGQDAEHACDEALSVAFIKTDATELLTMVPASVPQAKVMARRMGFRHLFGRPALWPAGGVRHDVGFYGLTLSDWIARGSCADKGRWFHERMHELRADSHPADPVHDAFVGAAVAMIVAGNVSKAVETYNRWARFALYQPVAVVSTDPLLIDIRQCVLRVEGDQFFVEAPHA